MISVLHDQSSYCGFSQPVIKCIKENDMTRAEIYDVI